MSTNKPLEAIVRCVECGRCYAEQPNQCDQCGATADGFFRVRKPEDWLVATESDESIQNTMDNWLVRVEVEQWADGEKTADETVFRVAGAGKHAAVSGLERSLTDLHHVSEVEVVEVWQDD